MNSTLKWDLCFFVDKFDKFVWHNNKILLYLLTDESSDDEDDENKSDNEKQQPEGIECDEQHKKPVEFTFKVAPAPKRKKKRKHKQNLLNNAKKKKKKRVDNRLKVLEQIQREKAERETRLPASQKVTKLIILRCKNSE